MRIKDTLIIVTTLLLGVIMIIVSNIITKEIKTIMPDTRAAVNVITVELLKQFFNIDLAEWVKP